MRKHALAWSKRIKTFENDENSTVFIICTRGSCKTHEEKQRKKFVGQRLEVSPKSWLTPKAGCSFGILLFFYHFSSCDLHEPLVHIQMFFYHFRPCKPMRKHAFAGRNTQHALTSQLCACRKKNDK